MKQLIFLLITSIAAKTFSQTIHDGLEFSKTEFIFSKTENWVSSIDTVEVTNLTEKKIHLLKRNDPKGFEFRYPEKAIEPGKTELIEIIFIPKEKGKFSFSIPIYHSASLTAQNITYKGEVLSFDEFADVACPSFTKPNLQPLAFDFEIHVIDSATKKPLPHSFIEIMKGEYYSQHRTDDAGLLKQKATINYYLVLAEHTGYKSNTIAKHINPKNHKIIIELASLEKTTATLIKDTVVLIKKDSATPLLVSSTNFSLADYKKNNIVFLIDKSSSMNKPDCMPLLKAAMTQLTNMTRSEDRITIITYANEAKVLLPGTSGKEHEILNSAIQQLKCGGRTEGGKAIGTAYKNAEANFIKGGVNQIIIATDGGFNGLSENEGELMELVSAKAKEGIILSVLAFGQNRYGKAMITRLAKQGEGFYEFIENESDAQIKLTETILLQSKIK